MWRNATQKFWEDILKGLGKICWQKHLDKIQTFTIGLEFRGAVRHLVGCRGKAQGWSSVSPGYFKVLKV